MSRKTRHIKGPVQRRPNAFMNFLHGMGSILVIYPDSLPSLTVKDPTQRMRRVWTRTGSYLGRAMERFEADHPHLIQEKNKSGEA